LLLLEDFSRRRVGSLMSALSGRIVIVMAKDTRLEADSDYEFYCESGPPYTAILSTAGPAATSRRRYSPRMGLFVRFQTPKSHRRSITTLYDPSNATQLTRADWIVRMQRGFLSPAYQSVKIVALRKASKSIRPFCRFTPGSYWLLPQLGNLLLVSRLLYALLLEERFFV
jgi:hypothetical protein